MAARKWTQEQRDRQATLIQNWQPWLESTGPKSEEGKRRVATNACKGYRRPKLRALNKELSELLQQAQVLLNDLEEIHYIPVLDDDLASCLIRSPMPSARSD